ncbi:hypothetical protein ACFVX7_34815, partial [Streptomyces sp. NPDC058280]
CNREGFEVCRHKQSNETLASCAQKLRTYSSRVLQPVGEADPLDGHRSRRQLPMPKKAMLLLRHADLEDSTLGHLLSGKFIANAAWLTLAALAHNLTRALGPLASAFHVKARTGTIRRQPIADPARLATRARTLTFHLPERWPRQDLRGAVGGHRLPPADLPRQLLCPPTTNDLGDSTTGTATRQPPTPTSGNKRRNHPEMHNAIHQVDSGPVEKSPIRGHFVNKISIDHHDADHYAVFDADRSFIPFRRNL